MKTILIVEDDSKIAKALQVRLKASGYRVVQAFESEEAFAVAHQENPDVVVLDIAIPGGGGLDLAEKLRGSAKTAYLPIVFITASKDNQLRRRADDLAAFAFLEKPFDAQTLLVTIEDALRAVVSVRA